MKSNSIIYPSFVEKQATGCNGASNYREYCKKNSFDFCEVIQWSSSAGDWDFLVSKDGQFWQVLSQTNNYPNAGFSHYLSPEIYEGEAEDIIKEITNNW